MDLDAAHFLTSEAGARLLERARALRDLAPHRRPEALRGEAVPEHVRAVLLQDDLRRRAAPRCPHAEVLLFTPDALEQATAWPVAADRATRWPAGPEVPLADLTAGIGLDALATAATGRAVTAYEQDPIRALLLAFNADALGFGERIRVLPEDVLTSCPSGPLALLDPDRRPQGRRTRDPEAFEPPASTWEALLAPFSSAIVKLPPAGAVSPFAEGPQEVVSLGGRARERRVYRGAFPDLPPRRATRLPDGAQVSGEGLPWPTARAPREGDWLLDPDAAVTLADLVGDLATQRGLRPIHPRIAYLLGSQRLDGVPGHWVPVEAILAPRPSLLNAWLREHHVGRVTVRTRGVADSVADWRRRLRPVSRGKAAATVVVTRGPSDRWIALLGREDHMTVE